MIHDPLAMTSSVPSAHNIRICIPRIPATVRICPPPENKRSRLYRRPLGFPLGKVPLGKEGVRSAHHSGGAHHLKLKGKSCRLNQRRSSGAVAADKLNQSLEKRRSGRREFIHYRVKLVKLHNEQHLVQIWH